MSLITKDKRDWACPNDPEAYQKELMKKLLDAANKIAKNSMYGSSYYVACGAEAVEAFEGNISPQVNYIGESAMPVYDGLENDLSLFLKDGDLISYEGKYFIWLGKKWNLISQQQPTLTIPEEYYQAKPIFVDGTINDKYYEIHS